MKSKVCIFVVVVLILVAASRVIVYSNKQKNDLHMKYEQAENLVQDARYGEALELFKEIEGKKYKDT